MQTIPVEVEASYYQQFDAEATRDVPAEGFGGWKTARLPLELGHTALVVMHAWDTGTPQEYPGWHRAVEYMPRAKAIAETVFPRLLRAVRQSPLQVFHVVGGGAYYQHLPGYRRAVQLAVPQPMPPPRVEPTEAYDRLRQFRGDHVFPGRHNRADVERGLAQTDFVPQAQPADEEGIAENCFQLLGLCRHHRINHLVYAGFAVNACLLLSPGGMAEMSRHGLICSTIEQAVTAVENKETARTEAGKSHALWRVAVAFGFVYDLSSFLEAVEKG